MGEEGGSKTRADMNEYHDQTQLKELEGIWGMLAEKNNIIPNRVEAKWWQELEQEQLKLSEIVGKIDQAAAH